MLQSSIKFGVNHVASGIDRRRPVANEPWTSQIVVYLPKIIIIRSSHSVKRTVLIRLVIFVIHTPDSPMPSDSSINFIWSYVNLYRSFRMHYCQDTPIFVFHENWRSFYLLSRFRSDSSCGPGGSGFLNTKLVKSHPNLFVPISKYVENNTA